MSTNAMGIRFVAIGALLVCAAAMRAQATISSNASNGAMGSSISRPRPTPQPRPLPPLTVINTNDSGPGSLRQALADADDGDLIDFAAAPFR